MSSTGHFLARRLSRSRSLSFSFAYLLSYAVCFGFFQSSCCCFSADILENFENFVQVA